jgi:O-antigen/teichoic acid export membrane protein
LNIFVMNAPSPAAISCKETRSPQNLTKAETTFQPENARSGTARTFVAEFLVVPSGLLVAALLTRHLPLEDYGLFTLAITIVTWLQWSLTSLFTRSAIRLVSKAEDPLNVGVTILRTYAATGIMAALLMVACADSLAALFREPRLAPLLRVLALDIPLFCIAQAHRNILVGMHHFSARASASVMRWTSRAALISLFVLGGWGITGALLGALSASVCELIVCRRALPISWRRSSFPSRVLWDVALPLLTCSLALRLFDKVDIFMLSARALPAESGSSMVAIYGAAQNLALAPGLFTLAFAPTLLAAIARAQSRNDTWRVQQQSRNALRAVFMLAPVATAVSVTSSALLQIFFGDRFSAGATVLSLLIWSATAVSLITVCNTLLLVNGFLRHAVAFLLPLPLLAALTQWFVVPHFAMTGAASTTLGLALLCAAANVWAVRQWCGFPIPWLSIRRSSITCVVIAIAGVSIRTSGIAGLLEFGLWLVIAGIILTLLGEWESHEKAWFQSAMLLRSRN